MPLDTEKLTKQVDAKYPSRKAFAAALGMSAPYVSQILSGSKIPTLETVDRFATTLGTTAKSLVR